MVDILSELKECLALRETSSRRIDIIMHMDSAGLWKQMFRNQYLIMRALVELIEKKEDDLNG